MNWKESIKQAEHFKAIGQTDIWLDYKSTEFPWEFATECNPGGSHRLEISTSVTFKAVHPSGLSFRWSFDIEERSANGSGEYQIEVQKCWEILHKLPDIVAKSFREYLADCAIKVRKRGDEYLEAAKGQYGTADALEKAAEHLPDLLWDEIKQIWVSQ